jgi:hypothetical protein
MCPENEQIISNKVDPKILTAMEGHENMMTDGGLGHN